LTRNAYCWTACLLALLGQFTLAFGLPLPSSLVSDVQEACGCCPVNRSAGNCCCQPAKPVAAMPSCCDKNKSAKPSPVSENHWRLVGGVGLQKCHGPHGALTANPPALVMPDPPMVILDGPGQVALLPAFETQAASPYIDHVDPPPRAV